MSIDSNLLVPKPLISAAMSGLVTDAQVTLSVPVAQILASMDAASLTTVKVTLPAPIIIAAGNASSIITVAATVPLISLSASGYSGNTIAAQLAIPAVQLSTGLLAGNLLSLVLAIPAPIMAAAGYPAYTISVAIALPPPQIVAAANAPFATTFNAWVLNTRKFALTDYTNFNFNSFALFNGQVLACASRGFGVDGLAGGVVVLGTQANDNGTAIDARFRTGKADYSSSYLKRVPRAYLNYKADGDIIYRTITNETGTRSYLLPSNFVAGFQQRRVPIGKGPKSLYWQHEVENVSGSDFAVKTALVYPVTLRRRVQ